MHKPLAVLENCCTSVALFLKAPVFIFRVVSSEISPGKFIPIFPEICKRMFFFHFIRFNFNHIKINNKHVLTNNSTIFVF